MTDSAPALVQVDVSKLWTTVASVVIAFSFIFGTSIRQMYESVIFLFVVHPFDVGDALIVLADYHVVSDALALVLGRHLAGADNMFVAAC